MQRSPLVYATRRSVLALAQCRAFVARLRAAVPSLEAQELQIVTSGDRIQDRPLSEVGGKGLFVREIEEALLERRADFAVHSIKDLPATLPLGLVVACIPGREDPRDVLVAPRHGTLDALPRGARVGTSSLRRAVTVLARRPDLQIVPMRGNVDTRLRKVDAGECDAILLARAGLVRLGIDARATEVLSVDVSLPAPGQGALGIECRSDDEDMRAILSTLHDTAMGMCVAAERAVLEALGGDCKTPLGAHAERIDGKIRVRAFVARPDGSGLRQGESTVDWPHSEEGAREAGLALGASLR
jgi:hydroxymethylbilane synthase